MLLLLLWFLYFNQNDINIEWKEDKKKTPEPVQKSISISNRLNTITNKYINR